MYVLRIFYKSCTPSTQASFPESPPSLIKTNKASQTFTRWTVSFSDPRSSTHLSSLHLGAGRGVYQVSTRRHLCKSFQAPLQACLYPRASRSPAGRQQGMVVVELRAEHHKHPSADVSPCKCRDKFQPRSHKAVPQVSSRLPESGATQSNAVIVHGTHDASQPV